MTTDSAPHLTVPAAPQQAAQAVPQPAAQAPEDVHSAAAIERGRPSYSWRFGQDRRLEMVRRYVPLEGARVLDIGCGIGTYVRRFRAFSEDVYGVDVEADRVAEASLELPNIQVAAGEALPYADGFFDVVFSNEVIEHVADDRQTIREAVRVTRPGGSIVIFAPNRLYPFETHGAYIAGRYVFGNIPLVGWLPDPLRDRFAPHVRAYTRHGIRSLFRGQPVRLVHHGIIYPGFDNLTSRHATLGPLLRRGLYTAEHTRLQAFGLSHFLVVRKTLPS